MQLDGSIQFDGSEARCALAPPRAARRQRLPTFVELDRVVELHRIIEFESSSRAHNVYE